MRVEYLNGDIMDFEEKDVLIDQTFITTINEGKRTLIPLAGVAKIVFDTDPMPPGLADEGA